MRFFDLEEKKIFLKKMATLIPCSRTGEVLITHTHTERNRYTHNQACYLPKLNFSSDFFSMFQQQHNNCVLSQKFLFI